LKYRLHLIIFLLLGFYSLATVNAWTEKCVSAIALDAQKLMPSNLQWLFNRYSNSFKSGNGQKNSDYGSQDQLISAIVRDSSSIINLIRSQKDYEDAVFKMGRIARLVSIMNNPLNRNIRLRNSAWRTDYDIYLEKNQRDFRIRWYGIDHRPKQQLQLKEILEKSVLKMEKVASILTRTFESSKKPISSYDVQSIPFGVGSISYSHAVSNTAMSWLYIWDSAGGLKKKP